MSMVIITDKKGTRTIDMTAVDSFIRAVEADQGDAFEMLINLNLEQLKFAASELAIMLKSQKRLNSWLMSERGVSRTKELIDLARKAQQAGLSLWPEMLNGEGT